MNQRELEKKSAAEASLELVEGGMRLGLGTGSTAAYVVRALGGRVRDGLQVRAVPTSRRTEQLAREMGIPLATLEELPQLDLTIDGADEIDEGLNLIKGGGGALLREKIVAAASSRLAIVADSAKLVGILGAFPLPVEVVPFGWSIAQRFIQTLEGRPSLRRSAAGDPFVSAEGNYILDCDFGPIREPSSLSSQLLQHPAVVQHGLFIAMCDVALIGTANGVRCLRREG